MPVHFDHNYAFQTAFGRPLVDSTFTLALVTGQSVTDISQNVFANLGWAEVRLPAPVFEGDTIYSSSEVLEKRESRSRPNVGIVTVKTTDYNQDGTPVITFIRLLMVYKRHHCPRDSQADFRRCDVSIMARIATTREWVSFLAQLHYEDIPDAAVEHTREHLLDWIGSALAVGQDDLYNASVFHPATVVFPAAFAAAQQTGVSGREILAALVAGYEAGVRLRSYLGRSHYRVFHTTGMAGTLAAATAVSHLLASDEETMLHALSSTGLQAAELWEFLRDAADSKQPHTARAASAGLLAAYLARDGFTGAECILEGESGMVAGISSDADPNKLFQGGGRIGQCSRPPSGTALRAATPTPPPTHCYSGWKEQGLGADDIARVRPRVHAATIDVLGPVSDPRTIHRSTFFIGFVLAMIAKKGSAEIDDFTEEALGDSKFRRSIAKVEMVLDPEVDAAYPRRWIGGVGIETTGDERFTSRVEVPKGGPVNTLSHQELEEKPRNLTAYGGGASAGEIDRIVARIGSLKEKTDVRDLLPAGSK